MSELKAFDYEYEYARTQYKSMMQNIWSARASGE